MLIYNCSKSGIEDDLRLNYYTNVWRYMYKYAGDISVASLCTHSFNTAKIQELIRFNRALVLDGVLGNKCSVLHRR